MASRARNAARPPADEFVINADGTVDIRVRGETHYLRAPTVDEMQKFSDLHYQLLRDLGETTSGLAEINARLTQGIQTAIGDAALAATEEATDPSEIVELPPELATEAVEADSDLARDLLRRQRMLVADYWGVHVIPTLTDSEWKITPGNLPGFLSHPGSVGRLIDGWYSLPPVPGDG